MREKDEGMNHLANERAEMHRQIAGLKTAEETLRAITDCHPIPTFAIDRNRKVIAWNRALEEMLGVRQEDIVGTSNYAEAFYGKKLPMLIDYFFQKDTGIEKRYSFFEKLNGKICAKSYSALAHKKKGAYLRKEACLLYDSDGNLSGAIETLRDITEQEQAIKALHASNERFAKAFNAIPHMLVISTMESGSLIDVNQKFLKVTGFSPGEVIGKKTKNLNIWVPPSERDVVKKILCEQGKLYNREIRYRIKSGELRTGLYSAQTIKLNGRKCIISVISDITGQRLLNNEMAHLEQQKLIGEMAAGIGHEIRNPMTTVRGFLQMLGDKMECVQFKEYFDLMIGELDRANSIITEYLLLAKNKPIELKAKNLNCIVKALFPLIQADAIASGKCIEIELENVPDLLLDESEMRQFILNLVRNGLEAMSPGGTVTIKTFPDGNEVVLVVQDQGTGIRPDILEKLGTPFLTTKDNGTGLGLAVCYSIAARHKATVKIETGPAGTTFYTHFKRQQKQARD